MIQSLPHFLCNAYYDEAIALIRRHGCDEINNSAHYYDFYANGFTFGDFDTLIAAISCFRPDEASTCTDDIYFSSCTMYE